MARPRSISTDLILEAARQVFLDRGLGATTAEIAKVAGISEGTIFKRFGTKDSLFLEAMGLSGQPAWAESLMESCGQGELAETLEGIAWRVLEFFLEIIPKMAMLMSCHLSPEEIFRAHEDPPPLRGLRLMRGYFAEEQRLGRIRPEADAEVLARMFLGGLHSFAWNEQTGINERMPMEPSVFIRGFVAVLLDGAEAAP